MAIGFETRILVIRWGIWVNQTGADDRAVWGNTTQDNVSLYREMAESLMAINSGGWEVVASIPLDQGSYYGTGLPNSHGMGQQTWGGGYGYGSSATAGSALVLKRQIDDAGSVAAAGRAAAYAAELERSAKAWQIRYTPIEKRSAKKGMFSSADEEYFFDGKGYPSLADAETARADAAKRFEESSLA
jgi:hypothetical protein